MTGKSNLEPASNPVDFEFLKNRLQVSPFHRWLSMNLEKADETGVIISTKWRDEFVSQVEPPIMHGGVVAALIDVAGFYALFAAGVSTRWTAYLHTDYHRSVVPGDIFVHGSVVRVGKTLSVAEGKIFGKEEKLMASGRGGYVCSG